jgi:small-conductance mechanosensitive channel/CRP-like cAMP-binding protein
VIALFAATSPNDPQAGMTALVRHWSDNWALLGLGALIVAIAWAVNRFAPKKRRRIRRTVLLFLFSVGFSLAGAACRAAGSARWSTWLAVTGDLFEAFTFVNLGALTIFDLALPAVKVRSDSIVADLFIGMAYIVATIAALRGGGLDPSSVVTTSAIVSGVLALSLQATLGNILGGIALQLDRSISEGDWIQLADGSQGKVRAIHWRHTVVETRNWDTIIVPNSTLLGQNILILGKREGAPSQHRMWVYFNVDFRFPPARVIEVVREALLAAPIERVAADPPPSVICYDFAKDGRDSFAYYAVRYWLTDLAVDDPTSSAGRERIYAALRRAGIPLARPASTMFVNMDDRQDPEARAKRHHAERAAVLERVELFKPLTDLERAALSEHLVYAPFARGEVMTRQGAVAHWLYIIVRGKAEIRLHVGDQVRSVVTLDAPQVFGEMGLMTGEPRSNDVVAASDVECYRLDKTGFENILHDRPEIADAMSRIMAKRRVELAAARDGVSVESRRADEMGEAERILGRIRDFFGLSRESRV